MGRDNFSATLFAMGHTQDSDRNERKGNGNEWKVDEMEMDIRGKEEDKEKWRRGKGRTEEKEKGRRGEGNG